MIRFPCATCGERLSVPEKYAGRKGACPNCGSVNRVPVGQHSVPAQPILVELPPQAKPTPVPASVSPYTPSAETAAAAPIPARNAGAELAERPDRWTRGPIKIDPAEDQDNHATGGLLRFFAEGSAEENQWVLGHRKQWKVDRRGLPMFVKVGLLLASVLALIGLVWGFFYLLLKLVIAVNG